MKQRIITGVIAGLLFIFILFIGRVPFTFLAALIAIIAYLELLAMKKIKRSSLQAVIGAIAVCGVVAHGEIVKALFSYSLMDVFAGLAILLLLLTVFSPKTFSFDHAAYTVFSAFYIGIAWMWLVDYRMDSLALVLFILIMIWTTDSGAYFVGRFLGKRKLAPQISPNKTIEGAVGGVICAVIIAFIFQAITDVPGITTLVSLALVAALISVFGQLGDLVESALKRHFGVKDSGHILPGHGGLLDRFDSLIFIMPILYIFNIF